MADYDKAFEKLLKLEGWPGYANDPHDKGGETIAGISRVHWPGALLWKLVDALREADRPLDDKNLREMVYSFYFRNFWNRHLDAVDNQELAEWLFQMAVNVGWRQAVKFLQRAIGASDDGIFGQRTREALQKSDQETVLEKSRAEAMRFYRVLAAQDPSQVRFLRGWLNRAMA